MSGPPFRSVDRALAWAFQVVACDIGDISSIYRRRDTDPPHESEWTPFEKHGQAGAILGFADQVLDERERRYVLARYGNGKQDVDRMIDWMAAQLGTGAHQRRALVAVYRMHCGYKVGMRGVAVSMGNVRMETAIDFRRKTMLPLSRTYESVLRKVEPIFLEKGIVEYAHAAPGKENSANACT